MSSTAAARLPRASGSRRRRRTPAGRPPPAACPLDPHVGDVLREVDQHRPGTPGRRDVERLGDDLGDLGDVLDEVVVLRHPHRDAGRVDLLEGVRADRAGGDLSGDDDERDRSPCRRRRVGVTMFVAPGPLVTMATPGLPVRVGVTLGRVPGALLVADVDVPDRRIEDRVVDGKDGAPREAEGDLDALLPRGS